MDVSNSTSAQASTGPTWAQSAREAAKRAHAEAGKMWQARTVGDASTWLPSQPRLVMGVILFGVLLIIASSLVISAVDSHFVVNPGAGYSAEDAAQYSDSYKGVKLFTILSSAFRGLFAAGVWYRYMWHNKH